MEDTLREEKPKNGNSSRRSLNPCFNGRYSQRPQRLQLMSGIKSLNPCFNGRYSQSVVNNGSREYSSVLILVLMEDTLREVSHEYV